MAGKAVALLAFTLFLARGNTLDVVGIPSSVPSKKPRGISPKASRGVFVQQGLPPSPQGLGARSILRTMPYIPWRTDDDPGITRNPQGPEELDEDDYDYEDDDRWLFPERE